MFNYTKYLLVVFALLASFSAKSIFADTAWVNMPSVTNENLYQINKCNDRFLAIGNNGTIITSPDCRNWSVIPPVTNFSLRSVCYANNLYVAVGDSGTVITSEDGASWSKQNSGTKNNLISVAGGMGLFFAVAEQDTNLILASKDCVNWTSEMPDSSDSVVFKTVNYLDGNFVLSGYDPNCIDDCSNDDELTGLYYCDCYKLFLSSDGNSWTSRALTYNSLHLLVLTNNKYIALDKHPNTFISSFPGYYALTSDDG
ncbi:MAG: hypothetical protein Q4F84_11140, partial [Fibrobacter sp.]|nr:hypothetical protein [Fibrobacter sp.]